MNTFRNSTRNEVTRPIMAKDLVIPHVFQYSARRDIVKGCNPRQVAELVNKGGKVIPEGVIFATSAKNRYFLQCWQNEQSRQGRAAILGDGWKWADWGNDCRATIGAKVCAVDGKRGTVTQTADGLNIEFASPDGDLWRVGAFFIQL